jgi:hypothetical protein
MSTIPSAGRLECKECGHIFQGLILVDLVDEIETEGLDEMETRLPPQPCPACGLPKNEPWYLPDSLDDWLIMVDETVTISKTDRDRIGSVFVAAACEGMVREIIEFALQKQNVPQRLTQHVLDNSRGRDALLKLYDAVAPSPAAEVFREAALEPWSQAWNRLAQARNKYAHGKHGSQEPADAIHAVRRHMDEAFVSLRNAVLRRA